MLFLRFGKTLALWVAVCVLGTHAWVRSASAASLDASVPWAVPLVLAPLLLGWALASWGARRRPLHWAPLDADRLALLLMLGALLVDALSQVGPYMSIRVIREQVPPLFAGLYPALAFTAPLLLSRTARRADAATQGLLGALALVAPSSLLMLDGARSLTLVVPIVLLQLASTDGRLGPGRALRLLLVVSGLLGLATLLGPTPLQAMPSLAWIAAMTGLAVAVAARPRDRSSCRALVAAPVLGATLVALCGALLTSWLALEVDVEPALRTRLVLFQQHPNFLAPLFAVHAVLALGLALESRALRLPGLLVAALLAVSTVITDSRAGIGALVLGAAAVPLLLLLVRRSAGSDTPPPIQLDAPPSRARSRRGLRLTLPLALGAVLALAVVFGGDAISGWVGERMAKSTDYRVDAWRNSLAIIADDPWIGIGPHTFVTRADFAPGSRFFNEPESPHPHNALLYLTQAAGLPALCVFLAFLVAFFGALIKGLARGTGPLGRPGVAALLGASLGLLAANTLDLGLALETVVPVPLFLFAALLAGARRAPDAAARRLPPLAGLAWLVLLALPWVRLGVDPTRADTEIERAQLMAWMSGRLPQDAELLDAAREACARAIELDPDALRAYELLARWEESRPGGVLRAHEILERLVARAPHFGPSHALLGHTYLRAGMDDKGVESLRKALDDSHGSVHLTRHRAAAVQALARLGQRDAAAELLVEALRVDIGVVHSIHWSRDGQTGERVLPIRDDRALPLVEVVQRLYARHLGDRQAGRPVGRKYWMDTYLAFREAERDDLALAVLDDLEANVPEVERHSIAVERARIAETTGDLHAAIAHWREADRLAPNPFYGTQVTRLRVRLGEIDGSDQQATTAFAASGEILDQPTVFRDNLMTRHASALQDDKPGEAAELLERTLLYQDDAVERARTQLRSGQLYLQAARWYDAERCLERALTLLTARPYPVPTLQEGHEDSLPGRIARGLLQAWRNQGLGPEACQERAWALPGYFSPRAAPSLFRLAFFAENGQLDHLLKEAELQLLADPQRLLAQWARLEALEGLGRLAELRSVMRGIAERFAERNDVALLHRQLIQEAQAGARLDDWTAWKDMAVLKLLSGGYGEAADMFGQARALLEERPRDAARMAGWQARALLLSDRPRATAQARELLQGAVLTLPDNGGLRRRLEALQ